MQRAVSVSLGNMVLSLSDAMDLASPQLAQHQQRTGFIAAELGRAAGLPNSRLESIFVAALLHDVGALSLEEKIALALELHELAQAAGVKTEKLIFDPVLPNLSWDDAFGRISECVKAVRLMASGAIFQEPVRTMVGLSNLRSGHWSRYPARIEQTALSLLAGAGLSLCLGNVFDSELMQIFSLANTMS